MRKGIDDFHNEIVGVVVEGDRAAARLIYSGTHDGPHGRGGRDRESFCYAGAGLFTSHGGLLTSAWVLGTWWVCANSWSEDGPDFR